MRMVFVGSNPSTASITSDPFHQSTKSGRLVRSWIQECLSADIPEIYMDYTNVSYSKTENNRPLKLSEIKNELPMLQGRIDVMQPHVIVALGKTAAKALTLLRLDFYEMPHPSGLNRQLNDPTYLEGKIKGLREYVALKNQSLNKAD